MNQQTDFGRQFLLNMAILCHSWDFQGCSCLTHNKKRMQRALKTVTATVPESDLAMENPPVVSSYSRFSLSKGELLILVGGLEHFYFSIYWE